LLKITKELTKRQRVRLPRSLACPTMRIAKEARKVSRQLFKQSFTEGKLDKGKISHMVESLLADKPRHYVDALKVYQRLLRLEEEKRHVVIESATQFNDSVM